MDEVTRSILLNKEVIAVDQDALGVAGPSGMEGGDGELWVKPLTGGARALVLFNRGEQPTRSARQPINSAGRRACVRRFVTCGRIATAPLVGLRFKCDGRAARCRDVPESQP